MRRQLVGSRSVALPGVFTRISNGRRTRPTTTVESSNPLLNTHPALYMLPFKVRQGPTCDSFRSQKHPPSPSDFFKFTDPQAET